MLQERKCSEQKLLDFATKSWRNAQAIALDSRGSEGGISIIWDPTILHIEGFFSSQHTLSVWFKIIGSNHGGFLTNVYGLQ